MSPDGFLILSAVLCTLICLACAVCLCLAFIYTRHMTVLSKLITRATNGAAEELGARVLSEECVATTGKLYGLKDWTGGPVAKEFFAKFYDQKSPDVTPGEDKKSEAEKPKSKRPEQEKPKSKPPGQDKPAYKDAQDPQYQTLAVVPADVWGEKKEDPKPARAHEFKDAQDPQYQTLAVVPADVWGDKKPDPTPKQGQAFKDAQDPQYQTLAGIDDQVFNKN